jgi:hypothetical protein
MVVPPIYLRVTQGHNTTKTIREVVDGQQRVRSVLEFIRDGYRISKTVPAPWAGKKFSQLSNEEQQRIMSFSFSAEVFRGISDEEVLDVFCRLNLNSVPLNNQEKRNGKFFGRFKQSAYSLAHSYLEFWRQHKIFTERAIARMLEVEITSELLISGLSGMQDKKKSIDSYYEDYEDEFPASDRQEKRFQSVLETIADTFPSELPESQFHRPPLFYTLYCVVYHHMFGLPKIQQHSPKKRLTSSHRDGLRDAVIRLSEVLEQAKDPAAGKIPLKYANFVTACQRQTDNITPRKQRFITLFGEAF